MTDAREKCDVPPDKWHTTLAEMVAAVFSAFVSKGKPTPLAEVDAEVAVRAIYSTFRGSQIYIPFNAATERAFLHARIFAEFDGHNQQELCRKYEMSVQNVYRIIKKQREINRIARGEPND